MASPGNSSPQQDGKFRLGKFLFLSLHSYFPFPFSSSDSVAAGATDVPFAAKLMIKIKQGRNQPE